MNENESFCYFFSIWVLIPRYENKNAFETKGNFFFQKEVNRVINYKISKDHHGENI